MGKTISFNQSTVEMQTRTLLPVQKFEQIKLTRNEKIRNFAANIFTLFLWSGFHHLKLKYAVTWQKGDKAIRIAISAIKAGMKLSQDDIVSMLKGSKSTEDKVKMWSFYIAQNEYTQNINDHSIVSMMNKIIPVNPYIKIDSKITAILPRLIDKLLMYHPMSLVENRLVTLPDSRVPKNASIMDHLTGLSTWGNVTDGEANDMQLTLSQIFFRLLLREQFDAAKVFINRNLTVDQFQTTIGYSTSWKSPPWWIPKEDKNFPYTEEFKEHVIFTMLHISRYYNFTKSSNFPFDSITKFWLDNGLDMDIKSASRNGSNTLRETLICRFKDGSKRLRFDLGPHNEKILTS